AYVISNKIKNFYFYKKYFGEKKYMHSLKENKKYNFIFFLDKVKAIDIVLSLMHLVWLFNNEKIIKILRVIIGNNMDYGLFVSKKYINFYNAHDERLVNFIKENYLEYNEDTFFLRELYHTFYESSKDIFLTSGILFFINSP